MKRMSLAICVLAGCSTPGKVASSRGGVGEPCESAADCFTNLVCEDGACAPPGGDADSDVDADADCDDFEFGVSPQPADLVLVVDRSLSMLNPMPEGGTRWDAILAALDAATHSLEETIDFGLATFPSDDECGTGRVLVDPAAGTADEIMGALVAGGCAGGTPTAMSIQEVGRYLYDDRLPGHESHPPAIVVATDGGPGCNSDLDVGTCECMGWEADWKPCPNVDNCLDDVRTIEVIEALAEWEPRIPVYVVGLPGTSEFESVLTQMAAAGGTARDDDPAYYDAEDVAAIEAAMAQIAASLIPCVFLLSDPPDDPHRVAVIIDGATVPHTDDRSSGWAFTDEPVNMRIELFGEWCDALRDGALHEVLITRGCDQVW